MKIISSLFIFCLSLSVPYATYAYGHGHGGHGGGHGGHGGGHGGGGGHSSGAHGGTAHGGGFGSHPAARGTGGMHSGTSFGARSSVPVRAGRTGNMPLTRTTAARGVNSIGGYRGTVTTHNAATTGTVTNHREYAYTGGGYFYGSNIARREYYDYYYYNYYYPYYMSPYPYFGMWSVGYGMLYTPHYNNTAPVNNSGQAEEVTMDGYAVYEHDTIQGRVTLTPRMVLVAAKDSSNNYNYRFKLKKEGLESVTLYNNDNKELSLIRLQDEPKKLWRVVHEGKLNLYDDRRGFIYSPDDIDRHSLKVVWNGSAASLGYHSETDTKERLTQYVNKAYGLNLKPSDFTWKELLIYIDKLD